VCRSFEERWGFKTRISSTILQSPTKILHGAV
jgi:hypothetical protein